MKLSWLFVILLLVFVAVFSVQNAGVITVHFLSWQITMSAALVIQLAALLGGLVGLAFGAWSRRSVREAERVVPARKHADDAGPSAASRTPGPAGDQKTVIVPTPSTPSSPAGESGASKPSKDTKPGFP